MAASTAAAGAGQESGAEEAVQRATVDDVIEEIEKAWGHCAGLYYHGSTIFGNKKPTDIDLLVIVDEPTVKPVKPATTDAQFTLGPYEVSVYTRSFWLRKLEEMDLTMLTCLSLPPEFVVRPLEDQRIRGLTLDLEKLAEAIVSYAEYTWIKARRVLLRWRDPHKSSKNVYFVFRVIELGRQLVEHGRIIDFIAANHWWEHIHGLYESLEIKSEPIDWKVVEAVMASHFQSEVARFQASVEHARKGPAEEGPAPPPGQEEEASCPGPQPCDDTCPVCLEPVEAGGEPSASACALANCRHRFHAACIAASVRSSSAVGCPLCRRPVHLSFNEDHVMARELERRGIQNGTRQPQQAGRAASRPRARQLGARRRYGGYPATVLLPEEPTPAEDQGHVDEGSQEPVPVEEQGQAAEEPTPAEDPGHGNEGSQEPVPVEEQGQTAEVPPEASVEPAAAEASSEASSSSLGEWEFVEGQPADADEPVHAQARNRHCSIT